MIFVFNNNTNQFSLLNTLKQITSNFYYSIKQFYEKVEAAVRRCSFLNLLIFGLILSLRFVSYLRLDISEACIKIELHRRFSGINFLQFHFKDTWPIEVVSFQSTSSHFFTLLQNYVGNLKHILELLVNVLQRQNFCRHLSGMKADVKEQYTSPSEKSQN